MIIARLYNVRTEVPTYIRTLPQQVYYIGIRYYYYKYWRNADRIDNPLIGRSVHNYCPSPWDDLPFRRRDKNQSIGVAAADDYRLHTSSPPSCSQTLLKSLVSVIARGFPFCLIRSAGKSFILYYYIIIII